MDSQSKLPTSHGVHPELHGSRNSPTAMYMAFSPPFHYDADAGAFVGGQFLDGRAASLEEQAKQPFLNPIEMANTSKAQVIAKIRVATYATLFRKVFGATSLDDTDAAYDRVAEAIAAYERSPALSFFSSKYDAWLAGRVALTAQEQSGLTIFERPDKGNCAACHPSRPSADGTPPLFTTFKYENIGTPKNPANPFYAMPAKYNPAGANFVDLGLGGPTGLASENGKFKVPTLRNIVITLPYTHNGYFTDLRSAVDFHNTRDLKPACIGDKVSLATAKLKNCWPAPEVSSNVNHTALGNLGLAAAEVDDLVAFLSILTDGWVPPP